MKSKLSPLLSWADCPLLFGTSAGDRACGQRDSALSGVMRQPYVVVRCARLRDGIQAVLVWIESAHALLNEELTLEVRQGVQIWVAHSQPCKGLQALAADGNGIPVRLDVHGARYQEAL